MRSKNKSIFSALLMGIAVITSCNVIAQAGNGTNPITTDCNPNGKDSVLTLRNYSLMHEDVRFKRYEAANEAWLYVFNNAPCFREQTYVDGVEIYEWKISQTKDDVRKKQLMDTLTLIYKQRIQYFGREGFVKGKWGKAMLDLEPTNPEIGLALIEESFALDSVHVEDILIVSYFKTLVSLEKKKKRTKDDILAAYERLTEIVDYNLKHPGSSTKEGIYKTSSVLSNVNENTFTTDKPETFTEGMVLTMLASYSSPRYTITNIDSIDITVDKPITEPDGSQIYRIKEAWVATQENLNALAAPYLDCPTLVSIYSPKFNAEPTNVDLMEKILLFFNNAGCTNTDLYFSVSEAYLKTNPDALGFRNLANAYRIRKNYGKAIEAFQKSVDLETDSKIKVQDYISMAKVALMNRNPQQAKTFAERALAINPNKGEAYLLIGDAYLQSASGCKEFDASAIYWVVVDQYEKAKNVDAGIAGAANRRIATYSKYFPTKKDAFFRNITEGSTYTLGCYPSLSTRVRFIE